MTDAEKIGRLRAALDMLSIRFAALLRTKDATCSYRDARGEDYKLLDTVEALLKDTRP
jgi:hypothetical protein